jgi:acetyl-CoA C-acetyltransferase
MTAKDSIVSDGLFDVYNQVAMGVCAEHTAEKHEITREQQDDFCLSSYTRAEESWKNGLFADEIAPVTIKGKKGDTIVKEDDDYKGLLKEKFRGIKSPFKQGGSVTAANSPGLNDGGAAVVMASKAAVEKNGSKPLARILGMWKFLYSDHQQLTLSAYADAACDPMDFPTAPTLAVPKVLEAAGLKKEDIDLWEFNEAFSVVGVAAEKILGLDHDKVNIRGGAVALGHVSQLCRGFC